MAIANGLDLGPTIRWYTENMRQLLDRLPDPAQRMPEGLDFQFEGIDAELGLSCSQVYGLLHAFPPQARERMALRCLQQQASLWFSQRSQPGRPEVTTDPREAMSSTAIVPSYVDYQEDSSSWCGFTGRVVVYQLPPKVVRHGVGRIIATQALCHELAHCIVTPEMHKDCTLVLPRKRRINSLEWFVQFSEAINYSGPMSHYASAYCDENGKLLEGEDPFLPINEALVESMTAYLLGFAFRADGTGLDPFKGRFKVIGELVYDYLFATRSLD